MGWWKMDPETGGIDFENDPSGMPADCKLINAIPGRDSPEDHYMGDGPADVMDAAFKMIAQQYKDEWGRLPHPEELEGCISFAMGSFREEGKVEFTDEDFNLL